MRYLVTGGAGFIGSSIAEALLARGDAVTILDDFSSGREENVSRLAGDVVVVRGDILDAPAREQALRGVGGVFHEAAVASVPESVRDPVRANEVNVTGTVRLLEDARALGIRSFVLASSAAAYGENPALPKHEALLPEPLSPYAASKVAGELYVHAYAHLFGMHAVALRYFNIFGAHQNPASEYAAVVPRFVTRLLRGEAVTLFGDGEQTRDFCHVDNVAAANLLAMDTPAARGQVFNVASGETLTVRALAEHLGRALARPVRFVHEPARPGDIRHSSASIDRATRVLGYAPKVSVEAGLVRVAHAALEAARSAGVEAP